MSEQTIDPANSGSEEQAAPAEQHAASVVPSAESLAPADAPATEPQAAEAAAPQASEAPVAEAAPAAETPASEPQAAEATVPQASAAPAADAPATETPATEPQAATEPVAAVAPPAAEPLSEEALKKQEEERLKREEERRVKDEERRRRDEAYATLEGYKNADTAFEVQILERVKGGLRGDFNGLRVFLPASHYGLRKNVTEDDMNTALGTSVRVKVHELQSDDTGYKSAVVTRRDILQDEFWTGIAPGSVHEGTVSSVTTFGAFVNIGGVEGLVHVSRLSRTRIENPADVLKKGDKLKVTVLEIDKEKRKLSLSHREHEESPWKGVEAAFPAGKRVKGTVKRITDFGAYVQIAPKIEGLLRISELSWTQRVKHPSDVVAVGQEIEVEVLTVSEEKQQVSLGYKQTQPNPWDAIEAQLPIGAETTGMIQQVSTQGAVVRVLDTFDGFMPRSKMLSAGRGKKVTIEAGQPITCVVADLKPDAQSLILAMKGEDGTIGGQGEDDRRHDHRDDRRDDRRHDRDRDDRRQSAPRDVPQGASVTLGDMLKDLDKSNLMS